MTRPVAVETSMKLSDTKQQLSQEVNRVPRGEARIIVEKSGLPVAAIISIEEYRRFSDRDRADLARRAALFERLARFSDAFDDVSDGELEQAVAKAQAEVRAERAATNQR